MTLYQVMHELQILLALILGGLPPVLPAFNPRQARRRPRRNVTKYY